MAEPSTVPTQQPPKYGIPCEGEKTLGVGREDKSAGWHWWLCLKQFLQEHSGPGPSSVLRSASALPAPCSGLNFQWRVFMSLKASDVGSYISEETKWWGPQPAPGWRDWLEWGMGQDLILSLHPHPCADTSQPQHLCRCFSLFLVPKLISNSLLNHSLRNCFANKLWAWALEQNNLIIGCWVIFFFKRSLRASPIYSLRSFFLPVDTENSCEAKPWMHQMIFLLAWESFWMGPILLGLKSSQKVLEELRWKQAGLYAWETYILIKKLLVAANSKRDGLEEENSVVTGSWKITMKLNRSSANRDLKADFSQEGSEIAEGKGMAAGSLVLLQWNPARLFAPMRDSLCLPIAHIPAWPFPAKGLIPLLLQEEGLYRKK